MAPKKKEEPKPVAAPKPPEPEPPKEPEFNPAEIKVLISKLLRSTARDGLEIYSLSQGRLQPINGLRLLWSI